MDLTFIKRLSYSLVFFIGILTVSLLSYPGSHAKKKCLLDEGDCYEACADQDHSSSEDGINFIFHPHLGTLAHKDHIQYLRISQEHGVASEHIISVNTEPTSVRLYILFHQLRSHIVA